MVWLLGLNVVRFGVLWFRVLMLFCGDPWVF